ncbi:MAG: SDR family NAD(P)-dependent oxidoreductase [Clostridia bacterium]|nr:SDR family NAD(P)-dependent oxidoreductase [Clostridia bacterium]
MKTAVVTGGSSGIGLASAEAFVKNGWQVFELSRREISLAGATHLRCDVSDEESVRTAFSEILKSAKPDLILNCAGFGISGAVEFTELTDAKRLFDVDFFGMVNVNRSAIASLRETGGRIINVSSVAAPVPIPFQTYYSAAKAAVSSYTMSLANELRPFGISVCAVLPGDIRTGFTAAREKQVTGDELYSGRISRSVSRMEKDEQGGMDPERIAKAILRIAKKKRVRPFYTVGFFYHLVTFLVKILPASAANRVIAMLYSK